LAFRAGRNFRVEFERQNRGGGGVSAMRAACPLEFNEVLNPNGRVAASHKQRTMKTTYTNPEAFESTYALLVRSEEKQRVETLIYTLLIVSTVFAVLQFGRQAAMMPSKIAHVSTTVSAAAQQGV